MTQPTLKDVAQLYLGKTSLVAFDTVQVRCNVTDVNRAYGKVRVCVEPIGGGGSVWVDAGRLGPDE